MRIKTINIGCQELDFTGSELLEVTPRIVEITRTVEVPEVRSEDGTIILEQATTREEPARRLQTDEEAIREVLKHLVDTSDLRWEEGELQYAQLEVSFTLRGYIDIELSDGQLEGEGCADEDDVATWAENNLDLSEYVSLDNGEVNSVDFDEVNVTGVE